MSTVTEGPNFVILDQESEKGEQQACLIPHPLSAQAQRLAELALHLPEDDAKRNESVILSLSEDGQYVIGMVDPTNFIQFKDVALALKVDTTQLEKKQISKAEFEMFVIIAYTGELASIARQSKTASQEARATSRDSVSWRTVNPQSGGGGLPDRSLDAEQSRGFRATLEEVLREGSRSGASDMHFVPGPVVGTIFRRIDGHLYEFASDVPRDEMERLARALADMAKVQDWKLAHSDSDASIKMMLPVPGKGEVKTRLRFAAAPALDGTDISVRFITQEFRDFDEMGHEPEQLEIIFRALKHRNGLILVTGETGSGKSTLLEAMLRRAEAIRSPHVIVVADPIEYENHRRTQIEIKPGYGWKDALRIALRKDPNIMVIGEVRDEEVAEIAFHAAYTGHLVLTTLHTNDVASTFARLTNLGIKAYDQGGLIRCVCSQQLVRRLCNNCKEPDPRSSIIAANIIGKLFPRREDLKEALAGKSEQPVFYQPVGCELCHFSGFKGRIAIAEVLEVTPDHSTMMSMGMKGEQTVEFAINEYGMLSFAEVASRKLIQGVTSFSEVEQWLTPPPPRKYRFGASASARPAATRAAAPGARPPHEGDGGHAREDAIEAEYCDVQA